MVRLYRVITTLIYPFLLTFILLRIFFKKEDPVRYKEKIFSSNFNIIKKKNFKLIWFHAASIGEFKSILPIIEELNKKKNKLEFLITTVTLSSSNLAEEELKKFNNVQHRFFPYDIEFLIRKFLNLWKPSAIFLVDSEIWPNLILNADESKIPLAIINARITSKTFRRWMFFPETAKYIFSKFNMCISSNLETKNYLLKLNVKNIFYNGNIKLINKIVESKMNIKNREILSKNRFWIAASTHNEEEKFCLQVHLKLKKKYQNIITVIAPRHIERVKDIKKLCDKLALNSQILDDKQFIKREREIIIINSFGSLPAYFKLAKSVFIGKSMIEKLKNVAGQSPIEAAKFGCKIYHGPYVYNFKEIYEILQSNHISEKINNTAQLGNKLIKDLKKLNKENNRIPELINNLGQKTLADTMKNINNFLFNEIK